MFRFSIIAVFAAIWATSATAQVNIVPDRTEGLAIVGATVLPMTNTERLEDQTILVQGDRILSVGLRSQVKVPAGFRVIEGQGRTLMPGLVDMHVHLSPEPGKPGDSTQRALAILLANGVTTARVMQGQTTHPSVRAAIEQGSIGGPRIYIAAPAVNDNNTTTPEQARKAVRDAKAAGFDLMKAHAISAVLVWEALQDEARKQSIPTAGHVTNNVGLQRAMAAGQQVEHLDSVFAELLPAGASRDFDQLLSGKVLDDLAKVNPDRFTTLGKEVAAKRSYQVPTLAAFERVTEMQVPFESMLTQPDASYVAPWIIEQWRTRRQNLVEEGFTASDDERMGKLRRQMVKALHDGGVAIMAGSDTPHPFHVWGFGLVREVETLSAAGLGPMAALRSATVVPRNYLRSLPTNGSALGWPADFGTITPGARADLLLLDKDPSLDITALRSISAVVAGGRLYDRSALQVMLADAHKSAMAQPRPGS